MGMVVLRGALGLISQPLAYSTKKEITVVPNLYLAGYSSI